MKKGQAQNLTKEEKNLLVTAHKKRLCEQRALRLVEMALEPGIKPDWLIQQVVLISPQHYDDITEERAVTGLCGYPVCSRPLPRVPNKQFQISTLTNRVYDIAERKKFCSSACFRASRHLRSQVPSSPLWMRDQEPPPEITLLDSELNQRGPAGDLVDLGVARPPPEDPPQVTTDAVIRGMVSDYDLLAERVSELRLPPEAVPAAAGRPPRRGRPAPTAHSAEKRHPPQSGPTRKEPRTDTRAPTAESDGSTVENGVLSPAEGVSEVSVTVIATGSGEVEGQLSSPLADSAPSSEGKTPGQQSPPRAETRGQQSPPRAETAGQQTPPQAETRGQQSSPRAETAGQQSSPRAETAGRQSPPRAETAGQQSSPRAETPGKQSSPQTVPLSLEALVDRSADRADLVRRLEATSPTERRGPPSSAFKRPSARRRRRRAESPLRTVTARLRDWLSPAAVTAPAPAVETAPAVLMDRAEAERRNAGLQAFMRGQVAPPPPPPREERAPPEQRVPAQLPLVHNREQDRMRRKIVNDHLGRAVARVLPPLGLGWVEVAPPLRLLTAGFHLTAGNVTLTPAQWQLTALLVLRHLLRQCPRLAELAREPGLFFGAAFERWQLTTEQLEPLQQLLWTAAADGVQHQSSGQARGATPEPAASAQTAPDRTEGASEGGPAQSGESAKGLGSGL